MFDSDSYKGLSVEDARKKAEGENLRFRIREVDGVGVMGTADAMSNRVNVRVRDEIVVEAYIG